MPIPYRFINTSSCVPPDKSKAELRKAVRSYVARVSAEPFKSKGPKSRNRKRREVVVFDVNVSNLQDNEEWNAQSQPLRQEQKVLPRVEPQFEPPSLSYQIGPNSVLPCSTADVFRKPYMAKILTNYVDNVCVRIPELDLNSPIPLCRTVWIPHILNTPVLFQVIALNAAIFYAVQINPAAAAELAVELLWIKQKALSGLVQHLVHQKSRRALPGPQATIASSSSTERGDNQPATRSQQQHLPAGPLQQEATAATLAPTLPAPNLDPAITDDIIAATVKMAAFEAVYGDHNAYHIHMAAVARMIHARGGLAALGMEGFLARMLVFIDTNSAAIMGVNGRLHLNKYGDLTLPRRQLLQRVDMLKYMSYCGGGDLQLLENKQYSDNMGQHLPKQVVLQA